MNDRANEVINEDYDAEFLRLRNSFRDNDGKTSTIVLMAFHGKLEDAIPSMSEKLQDLREEKRKLASRRETFGVDERVHTDDDEDYSATEPSWRHLAQVHSYWCMVLGSLYPNQSRPWLKASDDVRVTAVNPERVLQELKILADFLNEFAASSPTFKEWLALPLADRSYRAELKAALEADQHLRDLLS
jgi:hypothetical protein